jgi:hypothetical protein
MSTALNPLSNFRLRPQVETQCSVTVVYQDTPARERAIWLCHHLVREFWAEIDFKFSWWRFKYLAEPEIAAAAAQAAGDSDMILVASRGVDDVPLEVRKWFESWTPSHPSRDAALVLLTDSRAEPELGRSPTALFLKAVADRAGMDCLLPVRYPATLLAQEQVRQMHDRATQVTEVLDEILHHYGPPPSLSSHWGLNE